MWIKYDKKKGKLLVTSSAINESNDAIEVDASEWVSLYELDEGEERNLYIDGERKQ